MAVPEGGLEKGAGSVEEEVDIGQNAKEDLEGIFFAEQLKSFLIFNEQVDAFLERVREGLTEKD